MQLRRLSAIVAELLKTKKAGLVQKRGSGWQTERVRQAVEEPERKAEVSQSPTPLLRAVVNIESE